MRRPSILIENQQSRIRAINRFCIFTALLALPYVYIFYANELVVQSMVMLSIIILFFLAVYLNSISKFTLSKGVIIFNTNFAVGYFSIVLGFTSGIHLFLFSAPLITYLLFDFTQRLKIAISISTYSLNFLIIYIIHKFTLFPIVELSDNVHGLLYFMNFIFSLALCFFLIIYFANNNSLYITLLKKANTFLEDQHEQMIIEIEEKTKTHKKLSETLKEKDTLLSEIHHRVKNNLAVISGLLELQNYYVKDEKASGILKESRNRIKSIALLHEKFYENKNLDSVEIRSYVDELIHYIKLSFTNDKKDIKIHTQIDQINLPMNEALPFSLLINELATNSYKHAFNKANTGNIYISVTRSNNEFIFRYKDDGCGFDASGKKSKNSLGMNLIEAFSKQLKGNMTLESNKNDDISGVDFKLSFKLAG